MEYAISDDRLAQIGLPRGRMSLADSERQARLQHSLDGERLVARSPGGSAANSLASAAAMGCTARFVCALGDDDAGQLFRTGMEQRGVEVRGIACGRATGSCLVLVTADAERTLSTHLGANTALQVPPGADVADADCLYVEGYLAADASGLAAALGLARRARAAGAAIALSFSDPGMVEGCADGLAQLMEGGTDLLFCNADEARAWTGQASLERAADALAAQTRRFAITLGADGALLGAGPVRHRIAGLSVRAIDTNGAGDQFAGAMLAALASGADFAAAGGFANRVAAQAVQQYGPRLSADACRALARQIPAPPPARARRRTP